MIDLHSEMYYWGGWRKKFAWTLTLVGERNILFREYYERIGSHKYALAPGGLPFTNTQRTTSIFEVLKS